MIAPQLPNKKIPLARQFRLGLRQVVFINKGKKIRGEGATRKPTKARVVFPGPIPSMLQTPLRTKKGINDPFSSLGDDACCFWGQREGRGGAGLHHRLLSGR